MPAGVHGSARPVDADGGRLPECRVPHSGFKNIQGLVFNYSASCREGHRYILWARMISCLKARRWCSYLRVDVAVPEVVDGAPRAAQQQRACPEQRQRAHVGRRARLRRQGNGPEARPGQQPGACRSSSRAKAQTGFMVHVRGPGQAMGQKQGLASSQVSVSHGQRPV